MHKALDTEYTCRAWQDRCGAACFAYGLRAIEGKPPLLCMSQQCLWQSTQLQSDMQVLGHTLPEIAAEKAGIFKRGASAVTVPQRPDAMQTLMVRAAASMRLPGVVGLHGMQSG